MSERQESNRIGKFIYTCTTFIAVILVAFSAGIGGAYVGLHLFTDQVIDGSTTVQDTKIINETSAIIDVVEQNSDSVVSIIVTQELPNIITRRSPFSFFPEFVEDGTTERQVGAGSGFIFSQDGLVVTNRHVVSQEQAEYSVVLSDGSTKEAEVLARDTVLDIAVLQIKDATGLNPIELGDSDYLKPGQRVIAIGYALGEFQNTVSEGIISGLSRDIIAGDGLGRSSEIDNVIQTDASINPGNSGGPLLDYDGNVIGVNVAVAENAENIGFAIPINEVKRITDSILEFGEIRRPYIGVRYVEVNETIAEANNLDVDYGALLLRGDSPEELAVIPGGPADKAGLVENDIILEVNGVKIIDGLVKEIQKYEIGDEVELKVLSDGVEKTVKVMLDMAQ